LHGVVGGRCTCGHPDCASPGKHPRVGHGVSEATTDLNQVKFWWGRWPDANIGIAPGEAAGFFALDIDDRHDGAASLALLEKAHGPLPHTVMQHTGGGRHLLFRYVPGFGNSTGLADRGLAPGIDVRTTGSYLCAPPSLHASGKRYVWDPTCHPRKVAIADAPSWLIARLRAYASAAAIPAPLAGRRLCALLTQPCLTGHRNDTLVSLCNYFLWHRCGAGAVTIVMQWWNLQCCQPALSADEVARTVRSMARYRAKRGRRGDHAK
jgi:hypothetical protein